MTQPREPTPPSREREREFIRRLAASYDPGPLSPQARVAFNRTLEERLGRRPRARLWLRALGVAAAVLAAAWLASRDTAPVPGASPEGTVTARAEGSADWEYEALYPTELGEGAGREDGDFLPDEYRAIANLLDAS
jgi:hypothetical protein